MQRDIPSELFGNMADVVEPVLKERLQRLQNVILNQANLKLVSTGGELLYEGRNCPNIESHLWPRLQVKRAAQNRIGMTITVNVRYSEIKTKGG